jgi:hypothetical protein
MKETAERFGRWLLARQTHILSAWCLFGRLARRTVVCRARLKLTYIGGTSGEIATAVFQYQSSPEVPERN